jgi:hypothetical protein
MERGDVLEELYAADEDEFVEVRKRLARELREQGRGEEAAELAGLRKPPVPVFLANRLARERPLQVKKLVNVAGTLSGAQQRGDAETVRTMQSELKDVVGALLAEAATLAGKPLSDDVARRLQSTLRAAAVDSGLSEQLRRGVLSAELEPSGFDALARMELAPAPPPEQASATAGRQAPSKTSADGGRTASAAAVRRAAAREKRIAKLEAELDGASTAARDAEKALAKAEREAARARERVATLEARLAREQSD